jgi:hypothetical protein
MDAVLGGPAAEAALGCPTEEAAEAVKQQW